jgi:mRNA interferase MazF
LTKPVVFYKKGDVVDAPFPYQTNSEETKFRPVLVLAPALTGGLVCAYITKSHRDTSIPVRITDFQEGKLEYEPSYIQPSTLYTLDAKSVRKKYGTLKNEKVSEVIEILVNLLQKSPDIPPTTQAFERPKKPF